MKIALFEPDAASLWLFRAGLIRRLTALGHEVHAFCAPDEYVERLTGLGVVVVPLKMSRFITPLADLKLIWRLYRHFRAGRYDIVNTFTHKPNIYGTVAARLAGCGRVVASVTGLGVLFTFKPGFYWWVMRKLFLGLSRLSFGVSDKAAFWNADILDRVCAAGIIKRSKTVLVRGSGIDLARFSSDAVDENLVAALRQKLGLGPSTQVVLMVSRLVWGKGVADFIAAAETLYGRCPDAKFLLAGGLEEEGHQGVPRKYIEEKRNDRFLWLGHREDIRELMVVADVVVLPSHGEGIPRSMIEAMAMARPIVTTDTFGCREVVEHGRNGLMVPLRDPAAVAAAIEMLLRDPSMREAMGRYGRCKAEREFGEEIVVGRVMRELYELPSSSVA